MGTKDNSDFTRADSFPEKIEIIPLRGLAPQVITIPGSKSITNRALILAACSSGQIILKGGLWSEDTQVMTEALRKIGIEVRIFKEAEPANREFRLCGLGDRLPLGGTLENPLEIFVGNSGTSARFLAAYIDHRANRWPPAPILTSLCTVRCAGCVYAPGWSAA